MQKEIKTSITWDFPTIKKVMKNLISINETDHTVVFALQEWIEAIESGNLEKILNCYHDEAVLWGTFSDYLRFTPEEIEDYFIHLLALENLKINLSRTCERSYDKLTIISGNYNYSYLANGKEIKLYARYSMVYKFENGKWLILDHHSSLIPAEPY